MAQTLAQTIKARHPGKYDDIPDAELEAKVLAKYPGKYDDLPRTKAGEPEKPGPGDPAFYGDPNTVEAMRQAGEFRGTAAAAGPSAQILAASVVPPALGGAARVIPGVFGAAARTALSHPRVAGAIAAATPSLMSGDLRGAAQWGTIGAMIGPAGRGAKVLNEAAKMGAAPAVEAAASAVPVVRSTTGAFPAAVSAPGTIRNMIGMSVPAAAAKAAPSASSGAAVKALNTIQREFAKAVSKDLPRGAKIHLLLDENGIPVKVLTSGQAGRVADELKTYLFKTW